MSDLPPDLDPKAIRSLLHTRGLGRDLRVFAEVGSTNDKALAAGREGAPEGLAVLADRQSAGRGRLGRSWDSPPGMGIYTSVLLRPQVSASSAPLLTLAVGIAVAEAIRDVTALQPRLKWPNDLQLAGQKVGGILVEGATLEGQLHEAVVGIGINVNQDVTDFPAALGNRATSLRVSLGRPLSRTALVASLYNTLEHWYRVFRREERDLILERGREWSAVLGQPIEVQSGDQRWWGLASDLDRDGSLLVRDGAGTLRRVVAGDVSIRPARILHESFVKNPGLLDR
jgi:BirA family biotin operon repressor/biotin-[acetyl-CoA-carboxylase] ligase